MARSVGGGPRGTSPWFVAIRKSGAVTNNSEANAWLVPLSRSSNLGFLEGRSVRGVRSCYGNCRAMRHSCWDELIRRVAKPRSILKLPSVLYKSSLLAAERARINGAHSPLPLLEGLPGLECSSVSHTVFTSHLKPLQRSGCSLLNLQSIPL